MREIDPTVMSYERANPRLSLACLRASIPMNPSAQGRDDDLFTADGVIASSPLPSWLSNPRHIQIPRRSAITLTTTRSGLHISSAGLPAIDAIAAATHWDLVADAGRLGIAPPLAGFRMATLVVQHWATSWIASGAWLPADLHAPPGSMDPDRVRTLAHHCRALHPRLACRLWTATLAARLRPCLLDHQDRFPSRVRDVWRRLAATTPFPDHSPCLETLVDPRLWRQPHLLGDVLHLRGAAAVVRSLASPAFADHLEPVLDQGWLPACAPDRRHPSRALRISLGQFPGGIPVSWLSPLLWHALPPPVPRRTRLEVLLALAVARRRCHHESRNDLLVAGASDGAIRTALREAVLQGALPSLRSPHAIIALIEQWLEVPCRVRSLAGLGQAIWGRHGENARGKGQEALNPGRDHGL